MNEEMIFALQDYFRGLQARQDVRVVLLRAEGRAFCAGLDIGAWQNDGTKGQVQHVWRTQRSIATVMQLMRQCPQPIIRSEEHTSELQSRENLVCRLLLEKKKNERINRTSR